MTECRPLRFNYLVTGTFSRSCNNNTKAGDVAKIHKQSLGMEVDSVSMNEKKNLCTNLFDHIGEKYLISSMSVLPSHIVTPSVHPCEQPLGRCTSTGLGSGTKANLNLLCHIYFTPWHDRRTAHQLGCLMDRYPVSQVYMGSRSPVNPFWGYMRHYLSWMLYDAMSPNNILGNTGDIASHMEGCNHFTTSKKRRMCWTLCGTETTVCPHVFIFGCQLHIRPGSTDEKQPCW